MSEPLLAVDGLRRTYGSRSPISLRRGGQSVPEHRPALVDVSLQISRGETLGLVGESGSGKSTFARCVTLLERPDAGRVLFNGEDLTKLDDRTLRRHRRRMQVIFQDPYSSLNPRHTVGSTLREVLSVHRLATGPTLKARVEELLSHVGLPPNAADRYPSDFSGGQRQRICIARALAAQPDLLIADEAVSSLDVSIQAQIINLLLDLQHELGLAMIFISHNLSVVRHVAPRVAVMFGGRIVETLPPGVPLDGARHPYTLSLIAAAPGPRGAEIREREGAADDLSRTLPLVGCPFRARCPRSMPVCDDVDPAAIALNGGHLVACHAVAQDVAPTLLASGAAHESESP